MKKFITLAVLASLSLSAFAATSDDLKLKGKVPKKLAILVTPEAVALNLDLETSQTGTGLLVASVNEKSNSNSGYKITADSLNDGELVNQQDTTQSVTYGMTYDGVAVDLTTNDEVKTELSSGVHDNDSEVRITYTGAPHETRVEGNYTDTITFTISAN